MTEELKAEIACAAKRAFLLTHAHLGRDLSDEEITMLVTAVVQHYGLDPNPGTIH